jgi:hypothetical protein
MTTSRNPDFFVESDVARTFSEIRLSVDEGASITFNPVSRRAYCELVGSDWILFFVDGEAYKLPRYDIPLISELCSTSVCLKSIINQINDQNIEAMMITLVKKDSVQIRED